MKKKTRKTMGSNAKNKNKNLGIASQMKDLRG